jgi:histidinol-phosphatase (PHP family)
LYEPILRGLVETGTALEINTSGLRQSANETYPSPAIVGMYRAMGGRAVNVGSDAHRADAFAWGLADGYAAAAAAGFEGLAFRRGGAPVTVPLRAAPNTVAARSL